VRIAAAAFLCALVTASSGFADEPAAAKGDVRLAWNAPEGCPAGEAVLAEMRRILGGTASREAEARADVTRLAPDRWSVVLATRIDDTVGERSFEADSCAALASATALILAWTVDPLHASAPALGVSPPSPPVESSPELRTPNPVAPAPARPALSGLLALAAQGDRGTLPSTGAAAELTVGATLGVVRAEASGSAWLAQDAMRSASEGTHLHVIEAAFRGCWRAIARERFEIDPCLGAAVAHVSSDGFGETRPYQRDAWWWMARGDLLATWTLFEPVALRALVGVAAPLPRRSVVILDPQSGGAVPIHEPAVVAGRAALGVEVHFP
jgi:hypothetical protein